MAPFAGEGPDRRLDAATTQHERAHGDRNVNAAGARRPASSNWHVHVRCSLSSGRYTTPTAQISLRAETPFADITFGLLVRATLHRNGHGASGMSPRAKRAASRLQRASAEH